MSKRSCEELKIVELCANINYVSSDTNTSISGEVVSCSLNNKISVTIKGILDKFHSGVGRLKGFQLRLNIDESVKPVIQPPRRIPFSARAVAEEKLKELEKQDIIEKIDEPTVWLSPIHIVKQLDKVRMVVDMSVANKAIKRNRRVLPTPIKLF